MLDSFFSWLEQVERTPDGDPKMRDAFREATHWMSLSSVLADPHVRERLVAVLSRGARQLTPKESPGGLTVAPPPVRTVTKRFSATAPNPANTAKPQEPATATNAAPPTPEPAVAEKTAPAPQESQEQPELWDAEQLSPLVVTAEDVARFDAKVAAVQAAVDSPPEHADVAQTLPPKDPASQTHLQCRLCLHRFAEAKDDKCPECGHEGIVIEQGPVPDMSITAKDREPSAPAAPPVAADPAPPVAADPALAAAPKKRGRKKKADTTASELQQMIDGEDSEAQRPPNPVPNHRPDPTTDYHTSELVCDGCGHDNVIVRVPPALGRTRVSYRCLDCGHTAQMELEESDVKVLTEGEMVDYSKLAAKIAGQSGEGDDQKGEGQAATADDGNPPTQSDAKPTEEAAPKKRRRAAKAETNPQTTATEKVTNPMDAIEPDAAARELANAVLAEEPPEICLDAAFEEMQSLVSSWPDANLILEFERVAERKLDGTSLTPEDRAVAVRAVARAYAGLPVEDVVDENQGTAA